MLSIEPPRLVGIDSFPPPRKNRLILLQRHSALACFRRLRMHKRIRLPLQLLRQIPSPHRTYLPLHIAHLICSDLDYRPRQGTNSPDRSICLCKLCQ